MTTATPPQISLAQAHHQATLVGRLFERHGTKLSRAEQLNAVAYLQGAPSWHVLSAQLKAAASFGTPVLANLQDGSVQSWRVEIVHIDDNCSLAKAEDIDNANPNLTEGHRQEVTRLKTALQRMFSPEEQLVAYVDGVLGLLIEQEFVSTESDGDDYEESAKACIARLRQNLLPRVDPLVAAVPGARTAIVSDADYVWNGRPTCWVFLPLTAATSRLCSEVTSTLQDFAYPRN